MLGTFIFSVLENRQILENFETLHRTQFFLNLPASTVIEILKSDDLKVPSKEDVFNSVKFWVNYDDASRKNDMVNLISSVRLSLPSIKLLVEEVMKFFNSCTECMTSIRLAILNKISLNSKYLIQRETHRRRKSAYTIDIYDGEKKSWTLSKDTGIIKDNFASVIAGDRIIIIGGRNFSNCAENSVEYIDLKNGQKHQLNPLNQARLHFSAVTLPRDSSTDIYAICGYENNMVISTVERIYVVGGQVHKNGKTIPTNQVQMYSVETNSWIYRSQMIQARSSHSSVVFIGKLFIAGWYDNKTSIYLELPKPVYGISLCCFQNKILCMVDMMERL
ncbi:kelch-like protein 25 isoform X2 [Arctopsyche grandis]|uniref:kelch-like protein 25 isoform X2 n=2 Tax=Arctopsyche grandis TaxID=121162 RepID=UPI00406D82A6